MSEYEQDIAIGRMVGVTAWCGCGADREIMRADKKDCLLAFALGGWKLKSHRNGKFTVVCPACIAKLSQEKMIAREAKAAIRKERDAALAKCKAEMAKLKAGEETS